MLFHLNFVALSKSFGQREEAAKSISGFAIPKSMENDEYPRLRSFELTSLGEIPNKSIHNTDNNLFYVKNLLPPPSTDRF